MKRILTLLFIVLAATEVSNAQFYKTDTVKQRKRYYADEPKQQTTKGFDRSKLMVGGIFGMAFGDYTNINISPMAGYRFNEYIAAGVNVNFQFAQTKYYYAYSNDVSDRYKYTIFGGGLWGRVYPVPFLFLHAQPEYNSIAEKHTQYNDPNPSRKFTSNYGAPSLLLGGGYAQPIGGNSAFTISLLYDVIQDKNSPYNNQPLFQAGFNIGL
ncbi:hypothetical protein LX64_04469 [Chitinophaga skermanii]|uniref:Outer membrane protein with beta-barrel domain n=1 Tax=Chitinophaga skermanii TaxID=331697 RepID=A0A327Q5V2_9BACT|nr:hypothetical protein [Chitinophaga skermanii]RAI99915.1 hypothetical protein LX64_04469 [Chitinophaga skermanii]